MDMLALIGDFPGTNLETDKLLWRHHTDGQFFMNRMYKRDLATIAVKKSGPWSAIWKSVAPTKVKCFMWLVTRRACLTHDKLQKRGKIIVSRCYLCKEALENNNRLEGEVVRGRGGGGEQYLLVSGSFGRREIREFL